LVASSSINEDVVNDEFGLVPPDIITITQDLQDISATANNGSIESNKYYNTAWSVTTSGPNTTFYDWQWSIDNGANFSSVSVDGQPPGFLTFYRQLDSFDIPDGNQENVRILLYRDGTIPSANYDNIRFRVRVQQGTTEVISNSAQIIRVG